MEMSGNLEDYISAYKLLCESSEILVEKTPTTREINIVIEIDKPNNEIPTKDTNIAEETIEYVTFSSKFNDISKIYSITALEDEIEVFTNREDYGRLVDPDNIE